MAYGLIDDGASVGTKQPLPGARIDQSNPIRRGLIDSLVFTNGVPQNAARSSSTISQTGTPIAEMTSKGMASYLSAGASWNITSATNYAAGDFTIRCVVMFRAFGSYATLIDKDNGGGFREVAFFLNTSGNINYIGIGGVNNTDSVALGLSLNVLYDIVITRIGSTVAFYVDGAFKGNPTLPYSGTTGSANPLVLARNSSGGGANTNAVFLGFDAWGRGLAAYEVKSLAIRPRQLYEPINDPDFCSLGGGGTPVTIDGNVGAALGAGLAANVASAITVAGSVGAALADGLDANIASAITVSGSVGAALGDGLDANVASAITVAASVGAATAAGLSASISTGDTISASVGAAVAAGLSADVASSITVATSVGVATASGLSAGISTGGEVAAGTGAAVAAGLAAVVSSPITVAANVGAASAAGLAGDVQTGSTIPAGIGAAVALGLTAGVSSTYIVVAGVGAAVAVGRTATVSSGSALAIDMPRTRRLGTYLAIQKYRLGATVARRRQRLGGPTTKE